MEHFVHFASVYHIHSVNHHNYIKTKIVTGIRDFRCCCALNKSLEYIAVIVHNVSQ